MDPCLTEDVIAAMVEGTLDDERFSAAERHVSGCARCMRLVEEAGAALESARAATATARDPEAPPLTRGARVGRYEILEQIGAGGMGRVYAAKDPSLDRRVALKLLHPHSATPDLEARLLREAKAMARLVHPAVIAVYDAGHHEGQLFIAMELVDGGTLRQWLAARARAWTETLDVLLSAGRGLARAHLAGIVHRDFKPDNVLVGTDGRVLVSDFGLARTGGGEETVDPGQALAEAPVEEALTRTGAVLGTPAYMAPEQHAKKPADERSDVYSFCVTAYEALYAERPFVAGTLHGLFKEKREGHVREPKSNRGVPRALRRAILVGLRPQPEDRYATMDALLAALERGARAPWRPSPAATALTLALLGGVAATLGVRARRVVHEPSISGGAAVAEGCTTRRACVESHGGEPYVCRASDHACVPIASEDCTPKFEPEDQTREDTVWLGAMFPKTGPIAADGVMNAETVDLARSEIALATRAFGGVGAAQPLRRIALVVCDDAVDPARAAHHLVDDVGVPAVLGFQAGQEVIDLAGSLFIGRDVLTVATLSANPLITRLPQPEDRPRMVWRTTFNLDAVADVIARVVEDLLAPRYADAPMRVTLLRSDVPGALSFAERMFRTLHFNGKSAADNGGNYAEVSVPLGQLPKEQIDAIADRVAATNPSVLVLQGDYSTTVPVVEKIEERMANAPHKPTYVAALYTLTYFAKLLAARPDLRRRLFTIQSLSNSALNAHFVIRYNETHERKVTRTLNGGDSYDAVYLLAYATFALGSEAVTGPALARSFARLEGPGPSVDVGPAGVFDALTTLERGGTIDLAGTQSALNFDLATGDEPSDFELLCSNVDARGRATGEEIESGVTFDATTGKLVGALRCP